MKKYLLPALGTLLFCGCKTMNSENSLLPNTFYFMVEKNGNPLDGATAAGMRMFYVRHGVKVYREDNLSDTTFLYPGARYDPNFEGNTVHANPYIEYAENWFLELPDGDIDTVVVKVTRRSHEEGAKDRCSCYTPYTTVTFNGTDAPEYTKIRSSTNKIVFHFAK